MRTTNDANKIGYQNKIDLLETQKAKIEEKLRSPAIRTIKSVQAELQKNKSNEFLAKERFKLLIDIRDRQITPPRNESLPQTSSSTSREFDRPNLHTAPERKHARKQKAPEKVSYKEHLYGGVICLSRISINSLNRSFAKNSLLLFFCSSA